MGDMQFSGVDSKVEASLPPRRREEPGPKLRPEFERELPPRSMDERGRLMEAIGV